MFASDFLIFVNFFFVKCRIKEKKKESSVKTTHGDVYHNVCDLSNSLQCVVSVIHTNTDKKLI